MSAKRATLPTVVLMGRPNVGKSTLFNRITGRRRAIVTAVAGTTRDVITHPAEWQGREFAVTDTGGMFGATTDPLHALVAEHGQRAAAGADLIVVVVDGREGLVPADENVVRAARLSNAPIIIAVNKMDDSRQGRGTDEFFRVGVEPVIEVAAEHGRGVGDLLDEIVRRLPGHQTRPDEAADAEAREENAPVRIAIVGRPNVGKSSLLNRLVREPRVLVSDTPGTTRDAVDVALQWHGRPLLLVDTAGIRRPGRVAGAGQVESVSVILARRAMTQADVAVLVIDATEGVADQDAAIAGEAERAGCAVVVAVNKWDLVKGLDQAGVKAFDEALRRQLKFLEFAPLVHLSALTGARTGRLLELVDVVAANRRRRVGTGELNRFVERVTAEHPPPGKGRTEVRILYVTQTRASPPTFVFFTNVATRFHFSYERYLVNQLRDTFDFLGTPIRMHVRRRSGRRA